MCAQTHKKRYCCSYQTSFAAALVSESGRTHHRSPPTDTRCDDVSPVRTEHSYKTKRTHTTRNRCPFRERARPQRRPRSSRDGRLVLDIIILLLLYAHAIIFNTLDDETRVLIHFVTVFIAPLSISSSQRTHKTP